MEGAVVAEFPGQFVPLAACPEPEDDPVEYLPPIGPGATRIDRWRRVSLENRLDPSPEVIRKFPDRILRSTRTKMSRHRKGLLALGDATDYSNGIVWQGLLR